MNIKKIADEPAGELKGKRVIVRCDFNVQVFEGKILDDLRIRKTLPTISLLRAAGARVILISHNESKDGTGLRPICEHINEKYSGSCGIVTFIQDFSNSDSKYMLESMKDGDVVLFENLRIDEREKKNDIEFAKELAALADVYVNDAFAVSHRAHASVVSLPSLFENNRFAGIQLASELDHLKVAFDAPHPFVFILGGAKFETKLPLIQKFDKADHILLGGALLNDILKAKGYNVGKSLVSDASTGDVDSASAGKMAQGTTQNMAQSMAQIISNPKLIIPDDVIVNGPVAGASGLDAVHGVSIKLISEVGDEDTIMDVGPSMAVKLNDVLLNAQFILWNGPMGNYERGFKDQTITMAKMVTEACERSGVQAVLGGGDTTAAVVELGLEDKENSAMFISTGGGAMLEYLLNETLVGVEALKN